MGTSRSSLFKAALGAPLIPGIMFAQPAAARHDSEFDPWIEIYSRPTCATTHRR
jgi:hypothetical protein